jgi:adenine-specific DNA-methyltransferase
MIERRLRVAGELLKPEGSVLIVAIDDKEFARLGLLLEQLFPEAKQEMITTVINPRGKYRQGEFARCEEYLYFLAFGDAKILGEPDDAFGVGTTVSWRTLRKSDLSSARGTKKGGTGQFFPIYVDRNGKIAKSANLLNIAPTEERLRKCPDARKCFPSVKTAQR